MLLKSVKLENIRSYLNQELVFREGSTLLSGDIGCGKSSILLAIEFALFGIMGKKLSGVSLLRNGKNEGSVELKFSIDEKEYLIKRNVKRSKDKVGQTAGYIIKEGVKKDGTAVELKTEIINLLGYPKELVSKTKNLVYRYTVYTPQEEMKSILIEDAELRLDTLRKVFGIDKYKKISENCIIVTRNIKDKRKELEGKISGLEEKRHQKENISKEIEILEKRREELMPNLKLAKEDVIMNKQFLAEIEVNVQELNSIKQGKNLAEIEERNKHEIFSQSKIEIEQIDKNYIALDAELMDKKPVDSNELNLKITEKENMIISVEKLLREIVQINNEYSVRKRQSEEIKRKILQISTCPTCEQEVEKEYKQSIFRREDEKIIECDKGIESNSEKEKFENNKLIELKKELEILKNKISENSILELKRKELMELKNRRGELLVKQQDAKKMIGMLYAKKTGLENKIAELKDIETEYNQIRTKVNESIDVEQKLELENVSLEKEIEGVNRTKIIIEQEIQGKIKAQEKFRYFGELLEWLEKGFINLTSVMEKQIMLNVHSEFDELFKRWFNVLMEDETINVRLDDSFSPVIEQNGYEISIDNLSGGEKTSAALAYRLALNKVVNDLMEIKTKDLIILDEPTDGFSSEQLDKVREVLEQIGTKQTIIVSHETKIESFVDNVINVRKNEHVSEIS